MRGWEENLKKREVGDAMWCGVVVVSSSSSSSSKQ